VTSTIDIETLEPLSGVAKPRLVRTPVERFLLEIFEKYQGHNAGNVADYIPELSRADPGWFGISIVTLDGHHYSVGDTARPFTIQSISKPFVYGLALEGNGEEYVRSRLGVEPSGDAFNAISLDPVTGMPSNPMINAGAIATAAMVKPVGPDRLATVLEMFSRYVGHEVEVDEAVYLSESATGHRNRAIGHMLRNFDIVAGDPEEALDLYFQQCSIAVTCRDLALMAACLANGGVNPTNGHRAIESQYVASILSVMASCGMYDYAGEWIYRVGMPAKSGVSGGVLAVLPGQMGIGVFSPPLDERGNSVRGVQVVADFSRTFSLHMLNVPNLGQSAIRAVHDVTSVRSKRQRDHDAAARLSSVGSRVRAYELQGDLVFAAVEAFTRDATESRDQFDILCIDFKYASRLGEGEVTIIGDLVELLLDEGGAVALSRVSHLPGLVALASELSAGESSLAVFPTRDLALEWCEDKLLAALEPQVSRSSVPMAERTVRYLDPGVVESLELVSRRVYFTAGETP
jgi:glutaminase